LENKEDYTNKLKNLQLVMDEMEKREKLAKEHKTMKTLINKIKTYIKHKIHNIKMMFKLMRNAWKLNSIITWYEQYQTLPNQIRDINDNIYDIDSKCEEIL
jgi:oligoribonuclease NrnB/cAMP/cGMP phosphodiesterase (DHH superfamily)